MKNTIIYGECLEAMKLMPSNSIDSIVTDPPYGISFMGKKWDYELPKVEVFKEALRVLKPGGHMLCACGTRTQHRMACNIEDAGFEIRDIVTWLYGSGFPKSQNISKAIDKRGGNAGLTKDVAKALKKARTKRNIGLTQADKMFCNGSTNYSWFEGRKDGCRLPDDKTFKVIANEWIELKPLQEKVAEAEREVIGSKTTNKTVYQAIGENNISGEVDITAPSTDEAKEWDGWGTALKPAQEFFTLARKPLAEKTIAENVLKHGVGGLNIDACRVEINPKIDDKRLGGNGKWTANTKNDTFNLNNGLDIKSNPQGRFPANVIHSGDNCITSQFPNTGNGNNKGAYNYKGKEYDNKDTSMFNGDKPQAPSNFNDNGSSARFFYCAKASKKDRGQNNNHPTVKPTALMEYLIKLITPPNGIVMDMFMGSGTTIIAAKKLGFNYIGIEREQEYIDIAKNRIDNIELSK